MEVQGNVSNSITYKGNVTFKLRRNGKTYSLYTFNKGTTYLTDTITQALAGQDISSRIPTYLNLMYSNKGADDTNKISLLTHSVPFSGRVWGESAKSTVDDTYKDYSTLLLTATILPSDIISGGNVDNCSLHLVMQSVDSKELATISEDTLNGNLHTLYKSLCNGTEAIIEWRMIFMNGVES